MERGRTGDQRGPQHELEKNTRVWEVPFKKKGKGRESMAKTGRQNRPFLGVVSLTKGVVRRKKEEM